MGCKKDDKLSFGKTPYTGNQLRIDGYYYRNDNGVLNYLYCFYRNGVVLYLGSGYAYSDLPALEQKLKDGTYYNSVKNNKTCWGVYQIQNNNIKFDKWSTSSVGGMPAYDYSGNIVNDTVFKITRVMRVNKSDINQTLDEYDFKHCLYKPDSTNSFIN